MEIDKNIGRMIILKRFEDMGTRRSLLTLIYEGLQVFLTDHRPWYCRDGPYLVNVLNVINIQSVCTPTEGYQGHVMQKMVN